MSNEYIKYQHVEKLGNTEVDNIEFGTCYIFPKLDGTNAHIWYDPESSTMKCGSRRRELSSESDNAGFYQWATQNELLNKVLQDLNSEFPNCHVFGEWLVPHTLKTYSEDSWRRFYIFDVVNEDGLHVNYEDYKKVLDRNEYIDYIAPLRIIKNPKVEDLQRCLQENTYLIKEGEGIGEGIVVKNYEFVNKYGRQTWAKIVTSEFKDKHRKTMGAPECTSTKYVEEEIVKEFLTTDIVDKVQATIITQEDGWSSKYIPRLISTCFYDLVRENTWDIIKKFKNPTIDYKKLHQFMVLKLKTMKSELF